MKTFRFTILVVLVVLGLSACAPDASDLALPADDGFQPGDSSSAAGDDLASFADPDPKPYNFSREVRAMQSAAQQLEESLVELQPIDAETLHGKCIPDFDKYGLQISLPPDWQCTTTRITATSEQVNAAQSIWRFEGTGGDQIIALAWELDDAGSSGDFVSSFVAPLFDAGWKGQGVIDGRQLRLLLETETESPPRCGIVILAGKTVFLFDYQQGYRGRGFPDLETFLYGLSFTKTIAGSGTYYIPQVPAEERHATGKETSCCGYSDPGSPYPCYSGNCTWWAHFKRTNDLPDWSWGDAHLWAARAQAEGYYVSSVPSLHSIGCFPRYNCGMGDYGHVVHVESVSGDLGSYSTSEMWYGGFDCQVHSASYSRGQCGESFIYVKNATPYHIQPAGNEPDGTIVLHTGERYRNFVIKFLYDGTQSITRGETALESCNSAGYRVASGLCDPSWKDCKEVVNMDQSVIGPGSTARFTIPYFQVPWQPNPNITRYYFRPWNVYGGWMENWGGTHIPLVVLPSAYYQTNRLGGWDWSGLVSNGVTSGTIGKGLDGLRMWADGTTISYRLHYRGGNWGSWKNGGSPAGINDTKHDAVQITISMPGVKVSYRVYNHGVGWSSWASNGASAGTINGANYIDAIQVTTSL